MENQPIEVSASDVEKAIERGLAQLGLGRDQTRIEVVDSGSRGILGIGARDAVVRLTPTLPVRELVIEQPKPAPEPEPAPQPASHIQPARDISPARTQEPAAQSSEYALSLPQVAQIAQQTLAELLDKMGIECEVVIRPPDASESDPSPITLDILGDDLDVLIGRHGEVLNALQYVARLIVSREVEHWVNIVVDVERYKQRRAKSLQQLAERIADRVARTQQPVALEPMPPNERRVIHIALLEHPAVTTQSVGKGDHRKVTIIPRR